MKINNLATHVINKNNNANSNQKVAFKKNEVKPLKQIVKDGYKNFFSINRAGTMVRSLFIANAFVFLLGTRIITSRDKDEKREIFVRDIPSIFIAVIGVPTIQNFFAKKVFEPKAGFAFRKTIENPERSDISKWVRNKLGMKLELKPTSKDVSYSTLKSWYVYDENIASGFDGFSKRLANNKGNLKKIYSTLSSEIKAKLSSFEDNNEKFLKKLNENSNTGLRNSIIEALKEPKNQALKRAESLKTYPIMIGFALTLGLLGFLIPKLNIFITETIHKNKRKEET